MTELAQLIEWLKEYAQQPVEPCLVKGHDKALLAVVTKIKELLEARIKQCPPPMA